jgi:hypothetical protein
MRRLRLALTFVAISILLPPSAKPTADDRAPIVEALGWIHAAPPDVTEYDYVMTARVRLLFFWAGKDDVGGGYIRRGVSKDDPRQELFQVLFGSDPAKAPRAINRWGGGTEIVWHKDAVGAGANRDDVVASAFFGFMKSSKGKSVSEMQEELKKEKDAGEHQFTGILSRVDTARAVSLVVPLNSDYDYTLHQYADAEPVMLAKLKTSERPLRTLENYGGCTRAGEFLGTVSQLMDAAMERRQGPLSLCYVYDAQVNRLEVEHVELLHNFGVKVSSSKGPTLTDRTYDELLQVDFVSIHQLTGKRVYFTILTGTRGNLRGVPVQVRYQPNWWFQVVLNLLPKAPLSVAQASR